MPSFNMSLSAKQGFDYDNDVTEPFGFLHTLSVGEITFAADLKVLDPTQPASGGGASNAKEIAVAMVIDSFSWDLSPTNAIYISGYISAANKASIQAKLLQSLEDLSVGFKPELYRHYSYGTGSKGEWFKAFSSDATSMKGLVEKSSGEVTIHVSDEPAMHVVEVPVIHSFAIGIKPITTAQTWTLATEPSKKIVKSWGITVGSGGSATVSK